MIIAKKAITDKNCPLFFGQFLFIPYLTGSYPPHLYELEGSEAFGGEELKKKKRLSFSWSLFLSSEEWRSLTDRSVISFRESAISSLAIAFSVVTAGLSFISPRFHFMSNSRLAVFLLYEKPFKKGFESISFSTEVTGPCPGRTNVFSGNVSSLSWMLCNNWP